MNSERRTKKPLLSKSGRILLSHPVLCTDVSVLVFGIPSGTVRSGSCRNHTTSFRATDGGGQPRDDATTYEVPHISSHGASVHAFPVYNNVQGKPYRWFCFHQICNGRGGNGNILKVCGILHKVLRAYDGCHGNRFPPSDERYVYLLLS